LKKLDPFNLSPGGKKIVENSGRPICEFVVRNLDIPVKRFLVRNNEQRNRTLFCGSLYGRDISKGARVKFLGFLPQTDIHRM